MRRAQLAWRFCLAVLVLLAAPAADATPAPYAEMSITASYRLARHSASPNCPNDSTIGSQVWTVAISGTLALLGQRQALTILDIGDPARPTCRSHIPIPTGLSALQVNGDRAYLAVSSGEFSNFGLEIVDIHDPDNPTMIGGYDATGVNDLAVVGNTVYLATLSGLAVIDVSNPAAPVLASTYELDTTTNLKAVGDRLYLRRGPFVLEILDLTDPLHPVRLGGFYEGTISFYGFSVSGDRAYLIRPGYGVEVLDVSHPNNPQKIGTYTNILDGDTQTLGLQVIGNTLYIAGTKFEIYDVGSPTKAVRIGSYDPPGFSYDMRVVGNLAYLANPENGYRTGDYGFEIIDLSNRASPFLRGWFRNGSVGRFFYMQPIRR